MSIKDEIEKLIGVRRAKLEERDEKTTEFHQRQRERFVSLRVVLKEICAAVESKYIESKFYDNSARASIEIGPAGAFESGTGRNAEMRWEVEPNFGMHV